MNGGITVLAKGKLADSKKRKYVEHLGGELPKCMLVAGY